MNQLDFKSTGRHNIITLRLPPHSSHLAKSLDIGCFIVLKRAYGGQITAHIRHITKVEFFLAIKLHIQPLLQLRMAKLDFVELARYLLILKPVRSGV